MDHIYQTKTFRILSLLLIALAYFFLFFNPISLIVKSWFTHSNSQGFLIFIVSLYIVWSKRKYLSGAPIQHSIIKGSLVTTVGCLLLLLGKLSHTILLQELSIIVTLLGLVWLLFGSIHLRYLYMPICYLILMLPLFSVIFAKQLIYLQLISTSIASGILTLIGVPVFKTGHFIHLPHIILNVTSECSGINHIIALVALSVPLAYVTQKTRLRRVVLVLSAFFIGILANGLRVALVGIWTYYNRNATIHGPSDIFLVSFVFIFGFITLLIISIITGKIKFSKITKPKMNRIDLKKIIASSRVSLAAITTAIVISLLSGVCLYFYTPKPVYLGKDLNNFPTLIGNWEGKDVEKFDEPFKNLAPDSLLKRVYYDPSGNRVNLCIGYYAIQSEGREIFESSYNLLYENSHSVNLLPNSSSEAIARSADLNSTRNQKRVCIYYVINGQFTTSRYIAKLKTLMNIITKRINNAAIVIISFQNKPNNEGSNALSYGKQFANSIMPILRSYLI